MRRRRSRSYARVCAGISLELIWLTEFQAAAVRPSLLLLPCNEGMPVIYLTGPSSPHAFRGRWRWRDRSTTFYVILQRAAANTLRVNHNISLAPFPSLGERLGG